MYLLRHWTQMGTHAWRVDAALSPLRIQPVPLPPAGTFASFTGTAGDDTFNGTKRVDTFDLVQGGNDTAFGGKSDDTFLLGGAFTALDALNGGDGSDVLSLDGDYAAGFALKSSTLKGIETVTLAGGNSYAFALAARTVRNGETLTVDASALAAANSVTLDAAKMQEGEWTLLGGAGADLIHLGKGTDTVQASDGDDDIKAGANLSAADAIDGGAGLDTLKLEGNYAAGIIFGATTVQNIEEILLFAGSSYQIATHDATVAAGHVLTVRGNSLEASDSLRFDGSAETDGRFAIIAGGGDDQLEGGAGADTFNMGAHFTADDHITGGAGEDTMLLGGEYGIVDLQPWTVAGIERIVLTGSGFAFLMHQGTVPAGQALTIDGSALPSSFGSGIGMLGYVPQAGDVTIIGSGGRDSWDFAGTGAHIFFGNGGPDDAIADGPGTVTFYGGGDVDNFDLLNGAWAATEVLNGGPGSDALFLEGAYPAPFVVAPEMFTSVERLEFNYVSTPFDVTFAAGSLPNGKTITVYSPLFEFALDFDAASAAADIGIDAGYGGSDIKTGSGSDSIVLTAGGENVVAAGGGNDTVTIRWIDLEDQVLNAGTGFDSLKIIPVNQDETILVHEANAANFERLVFESANFTLAWDDALAGAGETFVIDASAAPNGVLTFFGDDETDARFDIRGGGGWDVLWTGLNDDLVWGGVGGDELHAIGADTFVYNAALEATGQGYDRLYRFDASEHHIDLPFTVGAIDPRIDGGFLHASLINDGLEDAVTASKLAAHHAVIFRPDSGTLAGRVFLVIDANGVAGYQANADIVINLISAVDPNLTTANFI